MRIPWTAKRSNQSILKEINPEYLLDADAEASIFWPPDVKSRLIGNDPDAWKNGRQQEKEMTKDEVVGWHHRLSGHDLSKLQETVKDRESWHAAVHRITELDVT